jgi:type IX secretion system PorP/SprF family membrane protein
MKTKHLFIISGFLFGTFTLVAQDVNYSQFYNAPIFYNPANTGILPGVRLRFTFRDQWPKLPYDFRAYHFSADLGDRGLPGSGGLGLIINSDNEGIGFIKNLQVGLNVAVRIIINRFLVTQVGIKAAYLQKRVNWDDFYFSDQFSEKYGNIYVSGFIPPDINTVNMADFAAGGIMQLINDEYGYTATIGFAADHLFEPDESFFGTSKVPLPRKYIVHADAVINTGNARGSSEHGEDLKLNPGFLYLNQSSQNIFEAGINLTKLGIYLGCWYRGAYGDNTAHAMILTAGYRYFFSNDISLKFIYSYDIQMAGALMGTGGAHEVTVALELDQAHIFGERSRPYYRSTRRGFNESIECANF